MPSLKKVSSLISIKRKTPTDRQPTGVLVDSIVGSMIQTGVIEDRHLQSSSVTTSKLEDLNVTTSKIADSNITTSKLANTSVTTSKIVDSNVITPKLADSSVTASKILDSNVTTAKIADVNVTTVKLADSAVNTAKIFDANVNNAKLSNLSVTAQKLTNLSVSENKIVSSNVTTAKLGDASVSTSKIIDGNVTGEKISSTINGAKTFSAYTTFNDGITNGSGAAWNQVREERVNDIGSIKTYRKSYNNSGSPNWNYPAVFSFRVNKGWTGFFCKVWVDTWYYLGLNSRRLNVFWNGDGNWLIQRAEYQFREYPYCYTVGWSPYTGSIISCTDPRHGNDVSVGFQTYNSGAVDVGFSDAYLYLNMPPYMQAVVTVEVAGLYRVSTWSGDTRGQLVLY